LLLACLTPLTVILGEQCFQWVPMVTNFIPEDMQYYFLCGEVDGGDTSIPEVAQVVFVPAWNAGYSAGAYTRSLSSST
jgi:hypothetical protein